MNEKVALAEFFFIPIYFIAFHTAAVSLHFLGRRGPMVIFHAMVAFFLACVAAINIFGPSNPSIEINALVQVFYFGAKFG